jgi:hypothetical protein
MSEGTRSAGNSCIVESQPQLVRFHPRLIQTTINAQEKPMKYLKNEGRNDTRFLKNGGRSDSCCTLFSLETVFNA